MPQIRKGALAGAAIALLLGAAHPSPAFADDPTPPPETTPAPDPAPPVPKPVPKPAPKPAPRPAQVYHAPVQHSTPAPAPQPTYTPPAVTTHHAAKKAVHHVRKHKAAKPKAKPAVTQPKVQANVKGASVVNVAAVPAASVATNETDALRRSLVITGIGLSALLFLLVVAVPSTAARFTPPGRVLMDHQLDLVLVGIALLLLTALLFALAGH
jgi:hypothetical protein